MNKVYLFFGGIFLLGFIAGFYFYTHPETVVSLSAFAISIPKSISKFASESVIAPIGKDDITKEELTSDNSVIKVIEKPDTSQYIYFADNKINIRITLNKSSGNSFDLPVKENFVRTIKEGIEFGSNENSIGWKLYDINSDYPIKQKSKNEYYIERYKLKLVDVCNQRGSNCTYRFDEKTNNLQVEFWSNGTVDPIIETADAIHLDGSYNFIENIYDNISQRDFRYASIPATHYARITFQENLTNLNDITFFGKGSGGSVEVYEKDGSTLLATFTDITDDDRYQIFLTNLSGSQDTFDLKVIGSQVDFDYVIDPSEIATLDANGDILAEWINAYEPANSNIVNQTRNLPSAPTRQPTVPDLNAFLEDADGSQVLDIYSMQTVNMSLVYPTGGTATNIQLWAYLGADTWDWQCAGMGAYGNINLGGVNQSEKQFPGYVVADQGVEGWYTVNWTGNWNQTDIDSLQMMLRSPGCVSNSIYAYAMYAEVNYTNATVNAPPTFSNTKVNDTDIYVGKYLNFSTIITDDDGQNISHAWFQDNFNPTIIDTETAISTASQLSFGQLNWRGQSFVTSVGYVINGTANLRRYGTGTPDNITVQLRSDCSNKPCNTVLSEVNLSAITSTSFANYNFTFINPVYVASTSARYWLVIGSPTSSGTPYQWKYSGTTNSYSGGTRTVSTDGQVVWQTQPSSQGDQTFKISVATFNFSNSSITFLNSTSKPFSVIKNAQFTGDYQWQFCANDTANLKGCSDLTDIHFFETSGIDEGYPLVTVLLRPQSKINGETVPMNAKITDSFLVSNFTLWIQNNSNPRTMLSSNTTPSDVLYLNYQFNSSIYKDGDSLLFIFEGYDSSNNYNQTNFTLTTDHNVSTLSSNPAVNPWITPAQSWYRNGNQITLRINVTDGSGSGSGTTQVSLENVNGSTYSNMVLESGNQGGGNYSTWNLTSTINGRTTGGGQLIDFYLTDTSVPTPNTVNYSITYSIDNNNPYFENPTIFETAPYYAGSNLTHTITWNDDHSGLSRCILSTNATGSWVNHSAQMSGATNFCVISVNYTSTGVYGWYFAGNDSVGNENATSIQLVTISESTITIPEIHYLYPPNNSNFSVTTIPITMNVTNITQAHLDDCWALADGDIVAINTTPMIDYNFNFSVTLAEGIHDLDVACNNTIGVTLGSVETGGYNINISVPPVVNNNPQLFNQTQVPSSPVVYSFGAKYEFNVTVTDDTALETVRLEIGGINYTAGNTTSMFNVTIMNLGAGNYTGRWFANDTAGNINNTETFNYSISKATPTGSISGNGTFEYPQQTSITGSESNSGDGDVVYTLFRDLVSVSNPDTQYLGVASYSYKFNATAGLNYTAVQLATATTIITQNSSFVLSLTFSPSDSETNGTETTVTGLGCPATPFGAVCQLWRNGTLVSNPDVQTLDVGTYPYIFNTTGNVNYSTGTTTGNLVINAPSAPSNATTTTSVASCRYKKFGYYNTKLPWFKQENCI